jgi:hypothetical protein
MRTQNLHLLLEKNKVVSFEGVKNAELTCEKGNLWVTGTAEGDILVKKGEHVSLKPICPLVIQGASESMFMLQMA